MEEVKKGFLDYIKLEKRYSKHTEENYKNDLDQFQQYLEENKKKYLTIKYQDISEYIIYLKKRKMQAATINRRISSLRSFYNYLVNNDQLNSNPFDLVKGVKMPKKLPNYFKETDFDAMLETINSEKDKPLKARNELILELLLATGLRVSELADIKINNIDITNHEIRILGKGKKERIVFFGKIAETKLHEYINGTRKILLKNKQHEYLLVNYSGDKLTDRGVRLIIDNIIKKASIKAKVTPHTFRHTFATMLLNNGCNIKSVQELLGHANLNTTSIYTHLTNEEVRNAYQKAHPRAKK